MLDGAWCDSAKYGTMAVGTLNDSISFSYFELSCSPHIKYVHSSDQTPLPDDRFTRLWGEQTSQNTISLPRADTNVYKYNTDPYQNDDSSIATKLSKEFSAFVYLSPPLVLKEPEASCVAELTAIARSGPRMFGGGFFEADPVHELPFISLESRPFHTDACARYLLYDISWRQSLTAVGVEDAAPNAFPVF